MKRIYIFYLAFTSVFFPFLDVNAQDLFDKEHTERFATFLYQSQQYELAAREYERLYILDKEGQPNIQLFKSYRLADKNAMGINRINDIYPDPTSYPPETFFELSRMLLMTEQFDLYSDIIPKQNYLTDVDKNLLLGIQSVYAKETKAKYALQSSVEMQFHNRSLLQVHNILTEYQHEKWKNPALAASLSAIVPGLGRWYAGDWKNAIVSALFVGVNGYQSYRGFRNSGVSSAGGWIFGAIGLGFYVGNIYGATWTAKRKNDQKRDVYKKRIEQYYFNF